MNKEQKLLLRQYEKKVEEYTSYLTKYGNQLGIKNRKILQNYARNLMNDIEDLNKTETIGLSKTELDFLESVLTSPTDYDSEITRRILLVSNINAYQDLTPKCDRSTAVILQQVRDIYSLEVSPYLEDKITFVESPLFKIPKFVDQKLQKRVPVLPDGVSLNEVFSKNIFDMAEDNTLPEYSRYGYTAKSIAKVLTQCPMAPLVMAYTDYNSLRSATFGGDIVYHGNLSKTCSQKTSYYAHLKQLEFINALSSRRMINGMNLAQFIMVKEGISLYEAVDTLIKGYELDIPSRKHANESKELVSKLSFCRNMGICDYYLEEEANVLSNSYSKVKR